MDKCVSRRQVLARLGSAGAGALLTSRIGAGYQTAANGGPGRTIAIAGRPAELSLTIVNSQTLRLTALPILESGQAQPVAEDLVLIKQDWPKAAAQIRVVKEPQTLAWGNLGVTLFTHPLALVVKSPEGKVIHQIQIAAETGSVYFPIRDHPAYGLGEGARQFDRRGAIYPFRHGQGGPQFPLLGGRMPVPWLAGPEGRALFFHAPYGAFDLTGEAGRFDPAPNQTPLPIDIFLVAADNPPAAFSEYAKLTGFPHMPPLWALGYQQSHRTLASREEIMDELKTFREKKLPCDLMIYLGTGFCPSGWNTGHGSFTFNANVFSDPPAMIQEMHQENFKIALHVVIQQRDLHGTVEDSGAAAEAKDDAANYWATHLQVFRDGVDGWWPDEGDWLSPAACLVRNRMYWEGPQKERPNLRPYALHRNGYAGIQRYGWLWSGDIESTWETLATQVQVGINTSVSGMPFWGTDTGGFVTTPELTGELYVRWFQFSSFCPLFRSHGRTWKLRLPWGWDTGDYGPKEITGYRGKAGLPDPKELHNALVEPICRKYLNLRYQLMPYFYSAVREAHDTGVPMMRAMWLHYPGDSKVASRGDQYLWGRDILVAPVTEKGATTRKLYLPQGQWYDFWTEDMAQGGAEFSRDVDLATMPLYVRAGAIIPMGPVKQYATEKSDEPLTVTIYPGADGEYALYEDDGLTFDYEKGESSRTQFNWNDRQHRLTISRPENSGALGRGEREFVVRLASRKSKHHITYKGKKITVRL